MGFGLWALGALILAPPARAWELELSGSTTFSYLYYSQQGPQGFFGPYDYDSNGKTVYAGINGWLGGQVNDLVSGASARKSSTSTSLFPTLRINEAMSLRGVYRIGNTDTGSYPGSTVSFAQGEWLNFWATLELPWGLFSFGKRDFGFGPGLQYDAGNRTEEYLSLATDLGPLKFVLGVYPWRYAGLDLTNENIILGDQGFEFTGENPYWNRYDSNASTAYDLFGFLNYRAGSLDMGFLALYYRYGFGPEGNSADQAFPSLSVTNFEGAAYMKYNDGRFFLNAELDWINRTAKWQRSYNGQFSEPYGWWVDPIDGSGSVFRPLYTESLRFMTEFGAFSGPVKLSFLYSFIPGPDRRHGVLIDRQPMAVDLFRPGQDLVIWQQRYGNTTVFRPYSLILSTSYGAGLGARDYGNDGFMVDASVFAMRMDYAVASNLNVYGSVFHANRVSHGQGWGYIRPYATGDGLHFDGIRVIYGPLPSPPPVSRRSLTFAADWPAIPDNDLGWEFDIGMDWKLLDTWTLSLYGGYFKPGKWFSYACIDKAMPNWQNPTSTNMWGANPSRSIDPIVAVNCTLTVDF